MPYGAVLSLFMPTAFAVLCLRCWCLHSYPGHESHDTPDIPIYGLPGFLPAGFYTHSRSRSGCLDTWLVLSWLYSHTRQIYTQASQKTSTMMLKQCAAPAYGCGSSLLRSSLRCRSFGFHGSAGWTVSVRNLFFFIYIYYRWRKKQS